MFVGGGRWYWAKRGCHFARRSSSAAATRGGYRRCAIIRGRRAEAIAVGNPYIFDDVVGRGPGWLVELSDGS